MNQSTAEAGHVTVLHIIWWCLVPHFSDSKTKKMQSTIFTDDTCKRLYITKLIGSWINAVQRHLKTYFTHHFLFNLQPILTRIWVFFPNSPAKCGHIVIIPKVKCVLYRYFSDNWWLWGGVILCSGKYGISLHLLKFPRPVPVGFVQETVTLGQLSLRTFLFFH